MKCPYCGEADSKVIDSRPAEDGSSIRRRRQCNGCDKRFTTYEKVETIPLIVIKKDNNREPYNRQKIFNIKGNHGGPGWSASAGRYTECYLNDIGRFNYCQFLEYAEYEDGKLGLTTRAERKEEMDSLEKKILSYMEGNDGFMRFNDKSNPDDLRMVFNTSKKNFKRTLGNMMKNNIIRQDEDGTWLI